MTVWKPKPVEQEPVIELYRWQAFEVSGEWGTSRHLVGWCGNGRVSSAIARVNLKTRTVTTRSGRKYKVQGDPGLNMDALYVWHEWLHIYGLTPKDTTPVDLFEKKVPDAE
jgi:hypothetical protein